MGNELVTEVFEVRTGMNPVFEFLLALYRYSGRVADTKVLSNGAVRKVEVVADIEAINVLKDASYVASY